MKNNYTQILFAFGIFFSYGLNLFAQPGSLDKSFSTDGKIWTQIGANYDEAQAVAVQSDGKIVVIGTSDQGATTNNDFAVIRYNADGSLDNTFSGDGKLTTSIGPDYDDAYALAIQPNGKIIVVGSTTTGTKNNFAMVRYNTDGTLDNSFDVDGIVTTQISANPDIIYDIVLQKNGKIVVTGTAGGDFVVARYNSNGSLDLTFNSQGWVLTDFNGGGDEAYAIALQADGKIVVGGMIFKASQINFGVARYDTTGNLDNTFSGDGKADTYVGISESGANAMAIQNDGKIILAGYMDNGTDLDFALVRFKTNGTLDSTFSGDGKLNHAILASDDEAYAINVQADGKILTAGYTTTATGYGFALVRYNSDGSFDNTFGTAGKVTSSIAGLDDEALGMALQSDGKIIVVGYGDDGSNDYGMVAARYNATASSDIKMTSFTGSAFNVYPNPASEYLHLEYSLKQADIVNIQLYDNHGRQINSVTESTIKIAGLHSETINLQALSSGIYNLIVQIGSEKQSIRIVRI